jgi:hypothetical protein
VTSLPSHARACIVFRRSADGSRGDRLGTGLQSIQISPYHAGLAGLRCLRLLCTSCFAAMLWSLLPVSAPVRRLTFGTFLRFPTRFSGIRFELSRRTARHERALYAVACTPWFGGNAHHGTTDTLVVLPVARFTTLPRSFALAYWITLSAWKSSVGGIVRPSALAVLRLMTSAYVDACSTGRSAGLAPLRILSM